MKMQMLSKKVSQKIANMSIVCAILVVSIHTFWPKEPNTLGWWLYHFIHEGFARIAVPFFFVTSGYFLSCHFDEQHFWKREVGKRLRTLVIPFFAWSIIAFLTTFPLSIIADLMHSRPFGTSIPLSDGRWLNTIGLDLTQLPGLYPLWYVRCLFFFVVACHMFKVGVERLKWGWLVITFMLALVYASYHECHTPEQEPLAFKLLVNFSPPGVFYFSVGVFIRKYKCNLPSSITSLCCLGIGIGLLTLNNALKHCQVVVPISILAIALPFLLCGVWGLMTCKTWPKWFTSSSFPVYLMHIIVMSYLSCLFKNIHLVNDYARWILSWTMAVAISIIVINLLKRMCPRIVAIILGGR